MDKYFKSRKVFLHLKGGLGNQLFQFAAAIKFAEKYQRNLAIDTSFYLKQKRMPEIASFIELSLVPSMYSELLKQLDRKSFSKMETYLARKHFLLTESTYDELEEKDGKKILFINGYFESEYYFSGSGALEIIKRDFDNFKLAKMESVSKEFIAAHIRLGDLVSQNRVYIPTVNYYISSILIIRELFGNLPVLIFTDDVINVQKNFSGLFNLPNVRLAKSESALKHLALISEAKAIVCSNSTFSWWAAKLSDRKCMVLVPDQYLKRKVNATHQVRSFWPETYLSLGELEN